MLAVDGTHASEDAARWCMQNVTRSGDLLHLIHVATPETLNLFSISGPPGTEFVMDVDWERRDQFWESVVRRTERLLDGTITNIIGEDASESNENFIRPPIELDAILDQTWAPVGEVLLKKANECGAEMIVVIKHRKTIACFVVYVVFCHCIRKIPRHLILRLTALLRFMLAREFVEKVLKKSHESRRPSP